MPEVAPEALWVEIFRNVVAALPMQRPFLTKLLGRIAAHCPCSKLHAGTFCLKWMSGLSVSLYLAKPMATEGTDHMFSSRDHLLSISHVVLEVLHSYLL